MSYQITWDRQPDKFLEKINNAESQRIIKKINSIIDHPKRYLETFIGLENYKLKVGNYRIILKIDENGKLIKVLFIGLRKNIYKYLRKIGLYVKDEEMKNGSYKI